MLRFPFPWRTWGLQILSAAALRTQLGEGCWGGKHGHDAYPVLVQRTQSSKFLWQMLMDGQFRQLITKSKVFLLKKLKIGFTKRNKINLSHCKSCVKLEKFDPRGKNYVYLAIWYPSPSYNSQVSLSSFLLISHLCHVKYLQLQFKLPLSSVVTVNGICLSNSRHYWILNFLTNYSDGV